MEVWKDIEGYKGLYQVSNLGRVRSLPKERGGCVHYIQQNRIIKAFITNGYKRVTLCKQKSRSNYLVHRLVAEAFVENHNRKKEVNHIDGNKMNNSAENLEWSTRKENMRHAYTHSARRYKPVIQCSKDGSPIKEWTSGWMASKELGISGGNICACCKGRTETAGGYIWKYKEAN